MPTRGRRGQAGGLGLMLKAGGRCRSRVGARIVVQLRTRRPSARADPRHALRHSARAPRLVYGIRAPIHRGSNQEGTTALPGV